MNRRRGFTLLEVLVALALMGSVLVTSILAFSKHHEQLRSADRRLEAVRISDRLIAELMSRQDGVPVRARGLVAGKANWFWQTNPVGATRLANVPMVVVRFQMLESGPVARELVAIDLVRAEKTP